VIHDLLHRLHADPAWYQLAADLIFTLGAALAVIACTFGRTSRD
jgi:hypothetical protein